MVLGGDGGVSVSWTQQIIIQTTEIFWNMTLYDKGTHNTLQTKSYNAITVITTFAGTDAGWRPGHTVGRLSAIKIYY